MVDITPLKCKEFRHRQPPGDNPAIAPLPSNQLMVAPPNSAPDLEVGRCGKDRTVRPRSRAPIFREGGAEGLALCRPPVASRRAASQRLGPKGPGGEPHIGGGSPRVLGLLCPLPLMRPLCDGRHRGQTDRQRFPRSLGWAPPRPRLRNRGPLPWRVCVAWRLRGPLVCVAFAPLSFCVAFAICVVPPHLLVGLRSAPAPHMYIPDIWAQAPGGPSHRLLRGPLAAMGSA